MTGPVAARKPLPDIRRAYRILRRRNGHLHWWPGRTRLEIITGAILTQNTAWTNVEQAIRRLRASGLLSLSALRTADRQVLEEAIRPSGYYRQKARKLAAFLELLDRRHRGSLAVMGRCPTTDLRNALLATWGIGPETADSILLYAFRRPVFVVDTYTHRVALRHRWARGRPSYDALQCLFVSNLPASIDVYNDYHAQIVWVGKHYCRTAPRCKECPLRGLL
ncbi:MAG: hypothetical protein V1774_01310 [Candidatus Eisenbacteria bacterium]